MVNSCGGTHFMVSALRGLSGGRQPQAGIGEICCDGHLQLRCARMCGAINVDIFYTAV
jgi:hypothetical protein